MKPNVVLLFSAGGALMVSKCAQLAHTGVYHYQEPLIYKSVSCVLSNLEVCAPRRLVTASSWSTVHRASCMRC